MLVELIATAGFTVVGYALLRIFDCRPASAFAVLGALPTGIAASGITASMIFALGLGFSLVLLAAIGLAVIAMFAVRAYRSGTGADDSRSIGLAVATALVSTAVLGWSLAPVLSFDSFRFVMLGRMLVQGQIGFGGTDLTDYPVMMVHLQALASAMGGSYLVYTPVAGGLLAVTAGMNHLLGKVDRRRTALLIAVAAVAGAGIFLTSNFMLRLQLSYLNSHVLFAGFLLLGVASSIRAEPGVTPAETRVGSLLLAAVAISRVEGLLVAALALTAIAGSGTLKPRDLGRVGTIALVPPALWYGRLLLAGGSGSILTPTRTGALLVLGALPLVVAATPRLSRLVPWLPLIALSSLTGAIVLLGLTDPESVGMSGAAMLGNMATAGQWGVVWWLVLPLLVVLTVLGPSIRNDSAWALLTVGHLFLILLLGAVRETPYRLGWGDSGNRMLIHVLPLGITYCILKLRAPTDVDTAGSNASVARPTSLTDPLRSE